MILEEIKLKTRSVHQRLEENSLISKIAQRSITLPQYIALLKKFYGFILPIEQRISMFSSLNSLIPDLDQRMKSSLLKKDLESLTSIFPDFEEVELCLELPEINNINQAFGYLYVIEGSTLGGKILSEFINECFSLRADNGAGYFNSYGINRGMMWKAFQKNLNDYSVISHESEEIIQAAQDTFLKLEIWINRQ